MSKHNEIIPLNLVFGYPVRWSRYKVMRDFIQNFYDAVGVAGWTDRFYFEYKDEVLTLFARDVQFNYAWLLHIGASTKRGSEAGRYAGFFGEGFKIASLCALRDFDWHIEMAASDWRLQVTTQFLKIDGQSLKMLAYRKLAQPMSTVACLKMSPLTEEDMNIFETARLSFYYEQNPLFGARIWSGQRSAVFWRSSFAAPVGFPQTYEFGGSGLIFVGRQALGSHPFPLIFCKHDEVPKDRERGTYYRMDVITLVTAVARDLPAEAAAIVLEALRGRWYDQPRKRYDFESWSPVIAALCRAVASQPDVRHAFHHKFPHLLLSKTVRSSDLIGRNRRSQALDWMRAQPLRYRLVQSAFADFGYPTVEQACEAAGGYSRTRHPDPDERVYLDFLERVTQELFGDYFLEAPPTRVIHTPLGVWRGMTSCIKLRTPARTPSGHLVRYAQNYVAIKPHLMAKGQFSAALSTYLHERVHCYGGDRSASFSSALTEMLEVAVTQSERIAGYSREWDQLPVDLGG